MYGKRFTSLAAALFLAFLFLSGQVDAQVYVPPVSAAACAECGGVGAHKPSCPHYRSSQEDSDSKSSSNKPVTRSSNRGDEPYSDSNFLGLIDGKPLTNKEYWTILMDICPYCGASNNKSHKSDCTIGYAFNKWHEYSNSGRDKDAIRMRDNIVALKLASSRGKATLASMRNPSGSRPSASASSSQKPAGSASSSTSLKDYTPAPEKKKPSVGNPIMPCPLMTQAPLFSGINEHSIVYDKLQSIEGEHPWGTVDMNHFRRSQKGGWGVFADYDIERYTNTPKGVVVLGKRQQDGYILWMTLMFDKDSGKYFAYEAESEDEDRSGKKVALKDIRFESEGEVIVREYSEGYKRVTDVFGKSIASGYNIKVLPLKVDGHRIIAHGPDPQVKGSLASHTFIYDDKGKQIAHGEVLEYYGDAVIARDKKGTKATIYNWNGQSIHFDMGGWQSDTMKDIRCYKSDRGPFYIIKIQEGRYAVFSRGFRQVGGTYSSENEAHEAWERL